MLEGRCLSYRAGIAYLPLFELVRNACGIAADEPPGAAATKIELRVKALELDVSLAHYLRHAFGLPTGDPVLAALDPPAIRSRTFDALRRQLLQEPARTTVENAVQAWDEGRPAEAEELLRRAVESAGELGTCRDPSAGRFRLPRWHRRAAGTERRPRAFSIRMFVWLEN